MNLKTSDIMLFDLHRVMSTMGIHVIVFSTPSPELVGKAINSLELFGRQSTHSTETVFIGKSVIK